MSLPIYQRVAVTDTGDVIPGAEYTVINENTGVAAPIYSDRTGATLLSAPYFADSVGTIQFFIAQGTTFRVAASGGVGTYTDRYVYGVAEAVLVQADGNVGIGTSFPNVALDITRSGSGEVIEFTDGVSDTGHLGIVSGGGCSLWAGGFLTLGAGGGGTNTERMRIDANGALGVNYTSPSALGTVTIKQTADSKGIAIIDSTGTNTLFLENDGTQCNIRNNSASPMVFTTNLAERMRIDSQGRLLLNTSSAIFAASEALHMEGIEAGTTSYGIFAHGSAGTNYFVRAYRGDNLSGSIFYTVNGLYLTTISDERLKENISNANDAGEKIDAINVRQFDWKQSGDHQEYGMIAQELIKVAPDAVHAPEDPEDMMGVDYAKLVPMLIKEVQSLRARVSALESN